MRQQSPGDDPAYRFERAGAVWRVFGPTADPGDNTVTFAAPLPQDVAAAVDRTVADYAARGHGFEWKVYGHDRPDLAPALLDRGFVAAPAETLLVLDFEAAPAPTVRELPGIAIARLPDDAPLDRIREVHGDDDGWLVAALTQERAIDPSALSVWEARAEGRPAACAWVRYRQGSRFASFWGGTTVPAWRRRGIYSQLVARRAAEARARGVRFVFVEARQTSRPILERLGFAALTGVTGYVWAP